MNGNFCLRSRIINIEKKVGIITVITICLIVIIGLYKISKVNDCHSQICPVGEFPVMPRDTGCICVKYALRR